MNVVAERLAQPRHRAIHCVVGDERAGPDLLVEVLLGNQPVAVLEQVDQEMKDPRLEVDGLAVAAQQLGRGVDLELRRTVAQPSAS